MEPQYADDNIDTMYKGGSTDAVVNDFFKQSAASGADSPGLYEEGEKPSKPVARVLNQLQSPAPEDGRGAVTDVPMQIVGGTRDAVQSFLDITKVAGDWANKHIVDLGGFQITDPETGKLDIEFKSGEEIAQSKGVTLPPVPAPDTAVGGITRGVTQFLLPFSKFAKATQVANAVTKTGKVARLASASMLTDFFAFDGHSERLSNLIEEYQELSNSVTQYLQSDPADTEVEGRFKNVLEGMGLDTVTAAAFKSVVKGVRSYKEIRGKSVREIVDGSDGLIVADDIAIKEIDEAPAKDILGNQAADEPLFTEKARYRHRAPEDGKAAIEGDTAAKPGARLEDVTDDQALEVAGLKPKVETPLAVNVVDDASDMELNVNLARIQSPEDIQAIIEQTQKTFSVAINKGRRGVQTNDMTAKLADDLGMTVEDLTRRQPGQAFNAEQALAARKLLVASGENLKRLAAKFNTTEVTDADRVTLRKAVAVHASIQKQVQGLTAEAGRALQSFNIIAKSEREQARMISDVLEATGGRDTADGIAEAINRMQDISQINRFARDAHQASVSDMVFEYWNNSILSGPTTHMANMTGNLLTTLLQVPERAISAVFSMFNGSGEKVALGESVSQIYAILEGAKDGLRMARDAFKTEGALDPLTKLDVKDRRAITSGQLSGTKLGEKIINPALRSLGAKDLSENGIAAGFVDYVGKGVRLFGYRMLSSQDAFFKGLNYRMELRAQAFRKAWNEGGRGKELAQKVSEYVNNPTPDMRIGASEKAAENTFTNPNKVATALSRVRNKIPGARYVVPFLNTPTNIIKYGFERTPFAMLSRQYKEEVSAGGVRAQIARGKVATGSMLMLVGGTLSMQGKVTGSAPADANLKKIWLEQNQEYSFVINGEDGSKRFISYNRFEPLGMLFGFSADMAQIADKVAMGQMDEVASQAVMAISKNVTSKTWLRGVSELVEVLDDPDRYSEGYIRNFIAGFMPNLINQTNKAFNDPYLREVDTTLDALKARAFGSDTLPYRRNLWGEPIEPRGVFGDEPGQSAINFLSPAYVKDVTGDPVNEAIIDDNIPISMPQKALSFPGVEEPVELTGEEYSRYVEIAGKLSYPLVRKLVTQKAYTQMTGGPDGQKAQAIKSIVSQARVSARSQLIKEFPTIKDRYQDLVNRQVEEMYKQRSGIDDSQ